MQFRSGVFDHFKLMKWNEMKMRERE
jgi:hypothetical protein